MKRSEYLQNLATAYAKREISTEAYDQALMNIDAFCDSEEDELIDELLDKADDHNKQIEMAKATLQEKYGDKVPANQCLKVMQEFHKITTQHYNDALQLVRELRAHGVNAKLNSQDSTIIIYHC